ncbi:RagB/SusD family nutrient uptake outer membrane protein [Robiginitalea marina]|uniref:RagB/SusD family nutrient uptake outer membrane protein n=1 Tax=Robiginitalea marina TaxID=2954105 RepID=A0ABT1B176_9FLAO|nr:RagB/SusD family nutrient uptake outer membrane protein [Robiginitalea marina]MCO5725934.1 RagB/SusD family nutrient uptake outer membrane protein [Robiginitalea marina]
MKNIKNLFLVIGVFSGLVACNDAIDIDQPGRLDADAAFQTVDDLEAGLFGVYDQFDISPDIAFQSIFTDELAIGFDNGGQGLADYGFVLNAGSTAPAVFWTNGYDQLNAANRLIEASEIVEPEAGEQARFNQILGEAYALRAWGHFTLLSYFSPDYTDDNALSVINLDFVPTIDQQLLRNTNGETFALIEEDLTRAASLMTEDNGVTRINDDFVTALRARIAAYRADPGNPSDPNWGTAASLSQQLIAKYPLANRAEYEAMFLDLSDGEVIFKLERTAGDNYDGQGATGSPAAGGWAGARFAFTGPGVDGSPYFEMGRSLFNLMDPADIRYDVNVHPSSVIDPDYQNGVGGQNNDILVVNKYQGSEGQPLMNDLKIFRASEMYLIRAEALAAQGNLGDAAALVKELRDARFGTATALPSFSNSTQAYAAILNERRVELAFEGHRYLDIKRLGSAANQGVLKDPVDCGFNGACTLSADDFRFTLPLPIVEFNANPGLREQQNPGY